MTILDLMLLEPEETLLKVCFAIFYYLESQLLQVEDTSEIHEVLKNLSSNKILSAPSFVSTFFAKAQEIEVTDSFLKETGAQFLQGKKQSESNCKSIGEVLAHKLKLQMQTEVKKRNQGALQQLGGQLKSFM